MRAGRQGAWTPLGTHSVAALGGVHIGRAAQLGKAAAHPGGRPGGASAQHLPAQLAPNGLPLLWLALPQQQQLEALLGEETASGGGG